VAGTVTARYHDAVMRGFDATAAAMALVLVSPLLVLIAVAIRAVDGGPILIRQLRAGKDGKPFSLLKFRTMRPPRPGEEGPDHDGVRTTRLGRLLRSLSADELPTLLNVLRGHMSLVGPRPLPLRYLERYDARQARRHEVRPGITGWAQVNGRNTLSWEEKFTLDVWYVDHRTTKLDLQILALTLPRVIRRAGVSHGPHPTMPEFTGSARRGTPA